jgi:hypothetical protein
MNAKERLDLLTVMKCSLASKEQLSCDDVFPTIDVDGVLRPMINSLGQQIHPNVEGTRNFWRWFGESRTVDAAGRPLVLYHGTGVDFDAFAPNERGIFFAESPKLASSFASIHSGSAHRVIPVYVRIEKVWTVIRYGLDFPIRQMVNQSVAHLKTQGYDGRFEREEGTWICFSPFQVKSALWNSGRFEKGSDNLYDYRK